MHDRHIENDTDLVLGRYRQQHFPPSSSQLPDDIQDITLQLLEARRLRQRDGFPCDWDDFTSGKNVGEVDFVQQPHAQRMKTRQSTAWRFPQAQGHGINQNHETFGDEPLIWRGCSDEQRRVPEYQQPLINVDRYDSQEAVLPAVEAERSSPQSEVKYSYMLDDIHPSA